MFWILFSEDVAWWEGKRQGGSKRNMKTDLAAVVTGDTSRGRTQFKTNCLGYRKWISLPFFVLTNRLQYSPERTDHTHTITSKLLQRLGAPRGAGLSWKNCETPPKRIRNNYARTQQSWKFNIWKMWNWKYSKKCAKKLLTGLLWTC